MKRRYNTAKHQAEKNQVNSRYEDDFSLLIYST